jgi:acetyl-CoA acyltransferase
MNQAVVVDGVRTPIGRAHPVRGVYRDVRSDDLAVACVKALLDRTGVPPELVEDVVLGNTQQTQEQGINIARLVALMSGLPSSVCGTTVNRLCGSSLQALNQASHAIAAGAQDVQIVGGLEHMHHVPMDHGIDLNPKLLRHTSKGALLMGVTAEFLSQMHGISREAQDQFAVQSHQRAAAAHQRGEFANELVLVSGKDEAGLPIEVSIDQTVRADATLESLGELTPAFDPRNGTVTAGNSSPINDGAAALMVMSEAKAKELEISPIARVKGTAIAGVDPCVMGTGPVPAVKKLLKSTGMALEDIDLFELNEAFAVQSICCMQLLGLDEDKVNVRGGSIAIGHPLGASGARIATTLVHSMRDRDAHWGIATMCIGVGQGIATLFERIS